MKSFLLFLSVTFLVIPLSLTAQSAEILFISNINGVVKNCGCGDPALGGMARIITLVQRERTKNPELTVVDGGDCFISYSYPDLNRVVCEQYALLKPDYCIPGDQEMVEGISFFKQYFAPVDATILETNLKPIFPNGRSEIVLNKRIRLLSYLDAGSFDLIKQPTKLKLSEERFARFYHHNGSEQKLVVVFHGTETALNRLVKTYPKIDVLLWAHAQSDEMKLDARPVVIGGGTDGSYIQKITLHLNGDSLNVAVRKIPVGLDIEPDAQALEIIRKWNIR